MLRAGILTFDFYPFIGGQGRVTYDLWRRLRERDDIDVTVVSASRNALPGHLSRHGFTQCYGRHPLFSLLATASVRGWARQLDLDVLHVNGGPGGVLLLRGPGVPVVYSLYHTYEQVARLMPGHGWKAPANMLERRAYGTASALVASTNSSAASLKERLSISTPARVIPCGVDFDAFPSLDIERDSETVLFVGRLDNRKNPQLLLRAFASAQALRRRARLVIVGSGPFENRLRDQALRLGIEARVRFERFVDHDTLVGWYNRATLVVVPSLFEGFGLSAVEAQSCGACVVATDSEGVRDVIADGETGVLTAPEPSALATAIVALLDDRPRREALAAAAAAHVRRAYAWDSIVELWLETYRGVATGNPRHVPSSATR